MNATLYLVLEPTFLGINYGAYNQDNEVVYEGFCSISEWSAKRVKADFQENLLGKLRGHGKVFTAVGIVAPFAPVECTKPQSATKALYQAITILPSSKQFLEPLWFVWQSSLGAWPHLPHYFLFDTHLSRDLPREGFLPPFSYDTNKRLAVHPSLLHSYGHKANLRHVKPDVPFVSLYIGNQVSVAVFDGETLRDALVTYSSLSPIMGWYGAGAVDPGFASDIAQTQKNRAIATFLTYYAGLFPMTESVRDFETLLALAGFSPKKGRPQSDDYSIETLEWLELSVKSFVRSIRHAVGAMMVHESQPNTLVVNTHHIDQTSTFWRVLTQGALSHAKIVYCSDSLTQAASQDLAKITGAG